MYNKLVVHLYVHALCMRVACRFNGSKSPYISCIVHFKRSFKCLNYPIWPKFLERFSRSQWRNDTNFLDSQLDSHFFFFAFISYLLWSGPFLLAQSLLWFGRIYFMHNKILFPRFNWIGCLDLKRVYFSKTFAYQLYVQTQIPCINLNVISAYFL